MKPSIAVVMMLVAIATPASAAERRVVQVILPSAESTPRTYVQFDETGAVRFCRPIRREDGAVALLCKKWVDAEPWPEDKE